MDTLIAVAQHHQLRPRESRGCGRSTRIPADAVARFETKSKFTGTASCGIAVKLWWLFCEMWLRAWCPFSFSQGVCRRPRATSSARRIQDLLPLGSLTEQPSRSLLL